MRKVAGEQDVEARQPFRLFAVLDSRKSSVFKTKCIKQILLKKKVPIGLVLVHLSPICKNARMRCETETKQEPKKKTELRAFKRSKLAI